MSTLRHALLLFGGDAPTPPVEGAASVSASASVSGSLVQATPGSAAVEAGAAVAGNGAVGSKAAVEASATVTAAGAVAFAGAAAIAASGQLSGSAALATAGAGQPLEAEGSISGTLAPAVLASGAIAASASVAADGTYAVPGAASVVATFDFELIAGLILRVEADVYAFGELAQVLAAEVRKRAAGSLAAQAFVQLAGAVRAAGAGSVTGTAAIAQAFAGRERRDAPTLTVQAVVALAARSGPGGHAVVFPSAVMTGGLIAARVGDTDAVAEAVISDFAPGAVVYRIASAAIAAAVTAQAAARRDTASAAAVVVSGATIGAGGLLQRATSGPGASGALSGAGLIAVGGAGALAAPVALTGAGLRTIYDSRHLHGAVALSGAARRETFSVAGLLGTSVAIATAGYEQRGGAALDAACTVTQATGGHRVRAAGSLAVVASAQLGQVLLGSSGHLAVTSMMSGHAPLQRIGAAAAIVAASATATAGYRRQGAAAVAASAAVALGQTSLALGGSGSLFVFGLILGTVAPFQAAVGELTAEVTVGAAEATRLLGSRVFVHAEAFVWPLGGFPVEGAADVAAGAAATAAAA